MSAILTSRNEIIQGLGSKLRRRTGTEVRHEGVTGEAASTLPAVDPGLMVKQTGRETFVDQPDLERTVRLEGDLGGDRQAVRDLQAV